MNSRIRAAMCAVSAAFLLVCALLPLVFLREEPPENEEADAPAPTLATFKPSDADRRVELYRSWRQGGNVAVTELDQDELGDELLLCSEELEKFFTHLLLDPMDYGTEEDGINLYAVTAPDGASIRVAERYRRWYGDWENWLRVAMDIDSLDVYYVYLSSNCVKNFENYSPSGVDAMVETFCKLARLDYKSAEPEPPSPSGAENYIVRLERDGEALVYELSGFTGYDPGISYLLVDYTMTRMPSGELNKKN